MVVWDTEKRTRHIFTHEDGREARAGFVDKRKHLGNLLVDGYTQAKKTNISIIIM